jgi:hypothetical protein
MLAEMEALVAEVAGTNVYRNVARHIVDTRLKPSFTGCEAKAWCLLKHAEAFLSLPLAFKNDQPPFDVARSADPVWQT